MRVDIMMNRDTAAFALEPGAAAVARPLSGNGLHQMGKRPTWLRFVQAYLSLFTLPAGNEEAKIAPLARFGAYEVRLIEFTGEVSGDAPYLWIELYAHDTCSSLDSAGCDDLDDAIRAAEDFIAKAAKLNGSPPIGNGNGLPRPEDR
jgi:hypothetical protein